LIRPPHRSPLFPYTTLFRSPDADRVITGLAHVEAAQLRDAFGGLLAADAAPAHATDLIEGPRDRCRAGGVRPRNREVVVCVPALDRKSTRLNSSHSQISYAV